MSKSKPTKLEHPEIAFIIPWPTVEYVAALPSDITKIVILDEGVVFDAPPDWLNQVSDMLDRVPVCQPFSRITFLDENDKPVRAMASKSAGYSAGDESRCLDERKYYQGGIWAFCREYFGKPVVVPLHTIKAHITAPLPKPTPAPEPEPLYSDGIREIPEIPTHDGPLYVDEVRILTDAAEAAPDTQTTTDNEIPSPHLPTTFPADSAVLHGN